MKRVLAFLPAAVAVLLLAALVVSNISCYPLKYKEEIVSCSTKYGLEPSLVAAIIYSESSFKNVAKSDKGAVGLMQIMPQTAEWISGELSIENDLENAKTNIEFGCFYLKYLFSKFDLEIEVLCAYNAGEAKAREWKAMLGNITEQNIPFEESF